MTDEIKKSLMENKHNSLFFFLTSKQLCKVGVNITDDMSKIRNEFGIEPVGYIDIQSLATTFNMVKQSMDDLGLIFVPNYELKNKVKGGMAQIDEYIKYAKQDAINSLIIYYGIMNFEKSMIKDIVSKSLVFDIDAACKEFAISYFLKYEKIRFPKFVNHMNSCYSSWSKIADKDVVSDLCLKLLDTLIRDNKIIHKDSLYLLIKDGTVNESITITQKDIDHGSFNINGCMYNITKA